MIDLVLTHTLRVFVAFLIMVHAVMLFFLMQGNAKAQVRQAIVFAMEQTPSASKKPKIPFIVSNPAPSGQLVLPAGEPVLLQANQFAEWRVDHEFLGEGKTIFWPSAAGQHIIQARTPNEEQRIIIKVK